MPSQARESRAEERRLSIRTLAIASASSAIAAIVTSRLWAAGTPIAAAMTPVLVTIVSELLHRPTAKVVERFTAETDALPEAMGAGPPPRDVRKDDPEPVPEQPLRGTSSRGPSSRELPEGGRVYRSGSRSRALPWGLIAATAALAFVIGVAVLTLPRAIAGQSLLEGSPPGYGSASEKRDRSEPAQEDSRQPPAQTEQQTETPAPDTPTTTGEPEPEPAPETTAPAPETTAPAPEEGEEEPPADAPLPKTAPRTTPEQETPQP